MNYIIGNLGGESVPWFSNASAAFSVILLAALWGGTAFNMLQFMSALKNIPRSYYEAADIDGASSFQKFLYITLPSLKPTSFMVILLASIGAMKEFALVQSLTNGGPGTANMFIVQYIYTTGFDKMKVGYASAASMVLFAILLVLGLVQMKIGGGKMNDVSKLHDKTSTTILTAALVLVAMLYLFPLVWFILSSFKPGSELFSYPLSVLPEHATMQNYLDAWSSLDFVRYFTNTLKSSVITTILTVIASATCGFAFAKI